VSVVFLMLCPLTAQITLSNCIFDYMFFLLPPSIWDLSNVQEIVNLNLLVGLKININSLSAD
jgi:hypothetical protein